VLDVPLATPKELGGAGGPGTNPEQLFAAGYAACFLSAVGAVGRRDRVDARDGTVTADVHLLKESDWAYHLAVDLHVRLPHLDRAAAEDLVAKAYEICTFSGAIRGNVEVRFVVG
jgi:Ohr subfamily peroxiredoxin